MFEVIVQAIIIGVELYVDPSSTLLNTGTIVTSCKTSQIRLISFSVSGLVTTALMMATGGDFKEQLVNMKNAFSYDVDCWSFIPYPNLVFINKHTDPSWLCNNCLMFPDRHRKVPTQDVQNEVHHFDHAYSDASDLQQGDHSHGNMYNTVHGRLLSSKIRHKTPRATLFHRPGHLIFMLKLLFHLGKVY